MPDYKNVIVDDDVYVSLLVQKFSKAKIIHDIPYMLFLIAAAHRNFCRFKDALKYSHWTIVHMKEAQMISFWDAHKRNDLERFC